MKNQDVTFTPRELFARNRQGGWIEPGLTTCFTDTAGTTSATAGQAVAKITELSAGRSIVQATTANRPTLSARYNLLTYSEQFDDADWSKVGVTVTPNQSIAPNGTLTADLCVVNNGFNVYTQLYSNIFYGRKIFDPINHTLSCYVKKAGAKYAIIGWIYNSEIYCCASFDLDTKTLSYSSSSGEFIIRDCKISAIDNDWCFISITAKIPDNGFLAQFPSIFPRITEWTTDDSPDLNLTGDGTSGIYTWGADLRPSSTPSAVPSYQRIAAANDYDTTGFPWRLVHDSTDFLTATLPDNGGGYYTGRLDQTVVDSSKSPSWNGFARVGNDLYVVVYPSGEIFKQTNLTGSFDSQGISFQNACIVASNGKDLYTATYEGKIYKKVNNSGDWVQQPSDNQNWQAITCIGNDIYACGFGGYIYKQTNSIGSFNIYYNVQKQWGGIAIYRGDMYASVYNENAVYVQYKCQGQFVLFQSNIPGALTLTATEKYLVLLCWNNPIYILNNGSFALLINESRQWSGALLVNKDLYLSVQSQGYGIRKIIDFDKRGSVYFGTPQGMSAIHNQSIGTTYNLPAPNSDIYGWCVVPERLSPPEEEKLSRYFAAKAGIIGSEDYLMDENNIYQLTADDGTEILLGA